jgi:hypothetical protein
MYDSRRLALRTELLTDGLTEASADRWIDAWIKKGDGDPASQRFWVLGLAWITNEVAAGLEPPPIADAPSNDRDSQLGQ